MGVFETLINQKTSFPKINIPQYAKPNLNTDLKIGKATGKELTQQQYDTIPKLSAPTGKELQADIFGNPIKPTKDSLLVAFGKDVGSGFVETGKAFKTLVSQPFFRTAKSIAQQATGEGDYTPKGAEDKFIYGEELIKPISEKYAEDKQVLESGGFGKIPSAVIAGTAVFGGAAFDLTPFGGITKNVGKEFAEAATKEAVIKVGNKFKLPEEFITQYGDDLLKAKNVEEVENIFKAAKSKSDEAIYKLEEEQTKNLMNAKQGQPLEYNGWAGIKGGQDSGFRSVSRDVANSYSGVKGGEPAINIQGTLKKPFVTNDQRDILELFKGEGGQELLDKAKLQAGKMGSNQPIVKEIDNFIKEKLSQNGYDGVVYKLNGRREPELQVFKKLTTKEELMKAKKIDLQPSKLQTPALSLPGKLSSELSSPLKPIVAQEDNAVNRIIKALKEAKPIRAKQEAIYSAKRSQQTAKIVAMGKKVPGEKGYFAQLGQLKGEMPKVQFEAIRKEISQTNIDELFNIIEKNDIISPFEKITAKTGLSKLLGIEGGTIPTKGELSLLNEIFPPEFSKAILEKRPLIQKVMGVAGNLLNLPRAVMATADLSAPLRQGIFLIGRPKQWVPAFKDMFKYAFSEKAYVGLMNSIKARPNYKLMRESGLAITDMGTDLLKREESFMSNIAEKIPIFGSLAKGSNRAYSGFLNKLRADTFDDLLSKAKSLGLVEDNSKILDDIAKFVNSATGRGDLGALNKASVVLNGAFFSPRLMASRINLLNPVYYAKLDPFVRKEALKSLFTFTAVAGTVLGLAKLGGASVGVDPRSADFGKIKVGDTRYDVLGGFQQYIVLASRLLSGQMVSSTTGKEFTLGEGYKPTTRLDIIQRFFESKSSPVASFALGLTKGETTMGEDFKVGSEIADRFIPMLAQDMFDLYRENGLPGLFMGLPGAFGVGSQTYADPIPLESKTATGKPTVQFRQKPSLGETIINKVTGKEVKPIPVKAVYDEVQILVQNGKDVEAQVKVNALSENDYALYKKLKAKDDRIKADEVVARITPIYKDVRKLISEGKTDEAQKIIEGFSEAEYKAYKSIKSKDYKNIQ